MDQLRGHSITYRIAVGLQQGCKVFTLQTLPERDLCELLTGQMTAEESAAKVLDFLRDTKRLT